MYLERLCTFLIISQASFLCLLFGFYRFSMPPSLDLLWIRSLLFLVFSLVSSVSLLHCETLAEER